MAGIYVHIPFCKQACHYCDFHFSTNLDNREAMIDAIIKELHERRNYVTSQPIESVYFGGGTPSILKTNELGRILETINKTFNLHDPEITLEANPDDLDSSILMSFRTLGINRLSIGIQSFDDKRLTFINRSHDSRQAIRSLENAKTSGFENISADLIFAIPPEKDSLSCFENDLQQLIDFDLQHVSLYNLTIEPKTVFGKWQASNKLSPVRETSSANQYELASGLLSSSGYEHYEVSNFAQPERYSRHNSSYWKSAFYLGVGPGAHSFNGISRSINISNNAKYIRSMQNNQPASTSESLSETQMLNEYVLTRTRTKWGLDLDYIKRKWGLDFLKDHGRLLTELINENKGVLVDNRFRLTSKGFSVADEVALRLFSEE